LRGVVLPVGGIKEKVLAAHRGGVRRVVMPRRNEADLNEVPSDVRKELEFTLVDNVDQVLDLLFFQKRAQFPVVRQVV
ncbi:MAG: S16 family serine protease, partial [Bdellovibrionota bacterium]